MENSDELSSLPDKIRQRVESGEYKLWPGKNGPVVRDAKTGQLVPGTGITRGHIDIGKVSKETAYKRKKSYRTAMEEYISSDAPASQRGSFAWFLDQATAAAEGSPMQAQCPKCEHKFMTPNGKRDGILIGKILEMMHGRPDVIKEVNVRIQAIEQILQSRDEPIHVYSLDDKTIAERRRIIEADFRES